MKSITITFALVGLYLVNEKDYSGKSVQLVHMELARKTKNWPIFLPPKQSSSLTVKDVLDSPNNKKQEMIQKWCEDVWSIWKPEENKIVTLLQKYINY